jgi:hypothetical protein
VPETKRINTTSDAPVRPNGASSFLEKKAELKTKRDAWSAHSPKGRGRRVGRNSKNSFQKKKSRLEVSGRLFRPELQDHSHVPCHHSPLENVPYHSEEEEGRETEG